MLALTEKQALIQALGQVVVDELKVAIAPLADRVAQLEKMLQETKSGEARSDENQPRVDAEFLRQYVAGALEAYEAKHVSHGTDGKNPTLDDIRLCVADLVAEAVRNITLPVHCVSWLVDRAGHLHVTDSLGKIYDVGQVVGRDGKDCDMELVRRQVDEYLATIEKPKDGLGIADIGYDGERTFTLANERVSRSFVIPFPLYQGIWQPGGYVRGDQVTSDNQIWMAMRDTDKEPGTIDSGWRLACKRGRDGKNGKDAK